MDQVNEPLFTVVLTSHEKPALVRQAIESVLAQTWTDFELMIVDSGPLLASLAKYLDQFPSAYTRLRLRCTMETEDIKRAKHIVSWVYNRFVPLARGRYITYLCDDDLYLPDYLAGFAAAIESRNPAEPEPDGLWTGILKERHTKDGVKLDAIGQCHPNGRPRMLNHDYLQYCHSKRAFLELAAECGGEVWSEKIADHYGADGRFMERMWNRFGEFKRVDGLRAINRRTPLSVFCGH